MKNGIVAFFAIVASIAASSASADDLSRHLNPNVVYYGNPGYGYGYGYRSEGPFIRNRRANKDPRDGMFTTEERMPVNVGIATAGVTALAGGDLGEIAGAGFAAAAITHVFSQRKARREFEERLGNPILECEYSYAEGTDGRGHNLATHGKECEGRGYEQFPQDRTNAIPNPGPATYDHAQFEPPPVEPVNAVGALSPEENEMILADRRRKEASEIFRSLPLDEQEKIATEVLQRERERQRPMVENEPPFIYPVRP